MMAAMKRSQARFDRRGFLRAGVAAAAAAGLPRWFIEECEGQATSAPSPSPNEGLGVGLVGCGGMGTNDAKMAAALGCRIVAICDVDSARLEKAGAVFPGARAHKDFRKLVAQSDVDAVICGTVDHWHTLVSMAAVRAGKDVYCEKPLTLTLDEGKRLVKVVRGSGRILQTGTQQRSDAKFRLACELVRNERIGRLKEVHVWVPAGLREGPFEAKPVPAELDWDFWQGQTPEVPYLEERCHRKFRYWWEYSGGTMTDWGAHHNDIALWAVGPEPCGPVEVEGKRLVEMIPGGFTAFSEYEVKYTYANGVRHTCHTTTASAWNGAVVDPAGQLHGIRFEGADGWIWVTRGKIEASDPELLKAPLPSSAVRLYASDHHMDNFLTCVKERKAPICDVETGHRSASMCHLGAISMRLGRRLKWDPAKEEFVGDREANGMLSREMRGPWDYGCVG